MIPGLLGIAAGIAAVIAYTEKFWEVKDVEKNSFKWVQVTINPEVWQYTDGDEIKAQVSKSGPAWRWEANLFEFGTSRVYGVCPDLEAAKGAAEAVL